MPVPTTITIVAGRFAAGTDSAALTAWDCQTVGAVLTANANLQTVPATFCSPESQTPAATGYQLDLTILQDWTDPDGICWFAFDHDTEEVSWELSLDTGEGTPADAFMHGTARVVALGFGGEAGTPLQSTVTWPVIGKPVKGPFAPAARADVESEPEPVAA